MDSNSGTHFLNMAEFDEQIKTPSSNPSSSPSNKLTVEPSKIEFFYEKFKQCYPMYKNPRGQCLIINIYQINGMPPRRWSDRDTEALRQLFEQLLFTVTIYTDSTHDLNCQNFTKIVSDFSKLDSHEEAQCCVVCLMSHGEEGFLTTKEGNKVPLDDIFSMFNNVNCPNLAGKPKLFFIQSCRDDPITGPAEDLGIRLSYSNVSKKDPNDETDSGSHFVDHEDERSLADNNQAVDFISSPTNITNNSSDPDTPLSQIFYHIPSLCDMIIGFPTQKGFIAYRKPEIGSWYMNAIVNVFSRYAHNTDLCAMLNMVNLLISNEVTNTGKKQMSEYTSKLTKPYFYFFPGLASETCDQPEAAPQDAQLSSKLKPESGLMSPSSSIFYEPSPKRQCVLRANLSTLDQNDSNWNQSEFERVLAAVSSRSFRSWKHLGRELGLGEKLIREFAQAHKNRDENEQMVSFVRYLCQIRSSRPISIKYNQE